MICLLVLLTIGLLSVKLTPRDKLEEVCNDKIPLSICANKTQHRLEENALENEDKKHVVREAKRIAIYYGMVMVTFINKAFVPFLTNWMCHTDKMVNYSQVLVLVTDKSVYRDISAQYPSLTVVYISVFEEMNGRQKYCTAGFMRIGIYRTRVVNWLIQENIPVFLFELDALWVSNPVSFVTSKKEYDLTIIPTYEKSFEARNRVLLHEEYDSVEAVLGGTRPPPGRIGCHVFVFTQRRPRTIQPQRSDSADGTHSRTLQKHCYLLPTTE